MHRAHTVIICNPAVSPGGKLQDQLHPPGLILVLLAMPPVSSKTFFDLPPEIRLQIYGYINLPRHHGYGGGCGTNGLQCTRIDHPIIYSRPHQKLDRISKFGQVNRQIRGEFLPVYHSTRPLDIRISRRRLQTTRHWLQLFGGSRIPLSRKITVCSEHCACIIEKLGGT